MNDQRRRWCTRRVVATVTLPVLVVSGCSLFGGDDDLAGAEAVADEMAAALPSGDFSAVEVRTDPAKLHEQWDGVVGAALSGDDVTMSAEATEVVLVDSDGDDPRAEATLAVQWTLGDHEWAHETTAPLVRLDDQWTVEFSPAVIEPTLSEGESIAVSTLAPTRADVIGAGDTPLVTNRPVVRVGIDKMNADAAEVEDSARSLAETVDVDADAFADRVLGAGESAFVEAITLREADVTDDIRASIDETPGARGIADELSLAPTRTFARPLLGSVGPATAEMIEESDGAIAEGDTVGLSGLQLEFDESLRGTAGVVVESVAPDDDGDEAGASDDESERELFRAEATDGTPLRITLDEQIQQVAEGTLADVDGAAALVAMRPSDGHLLAAASAGSDGYSIATLGQYSPGSTFKTATSLALLRSGLTPESAMSCPESLTVDGYTFTNYSDYPSSALGDVDLRTAVAQSCNTAFIGERDSAPQESLASAAAALGLGTAQELGFAAYLGEVPESADGTAHAAAMIGQGEVLASPLAMASVASSVSAGHTVSPVLVPESASESPAPVEPLTEDEAAQLRDLMGATVTEGSAAFLADVPGEPVIAKTGTAEYGTGEEPDTHAWMIAAQGDLAVAVFVESGESGSQTAGPLLEEFLRMGGP